MTPTQAVLAAEADRYRAMTAGDVDALRAACDPKLRYVTSLGVVETLDSWLDKIETETFQYERIEHPVDAIQIYEDVAVVHGRMNAYVELHGENLMIANITISILVQDEDQHWRLRVFQATTAA